MNGRPKYDVTHKWCSLTLGGHEHINDHWQAFYYALERIQALAKGDK